MGKNGRPPIFETPDELEAATDAYFDKCDKEKRPYTVTGLALALGFSSRQSLDETAKREGFLDSVKRAKLRVECAYEESLLKVRNPSGCVFALKNFGWKDEQKIESTSTNINANTDVAAYPGEVFRNFVSRLKGEDD